MWIAMRNPLLFLFFNEIRTSIKIRKISKILRMFWIVLLVEIVSGFVQKRTSPNSTLEWARTSLLHFINTELISLLKTKIVKVSNLSCRKHNRNNSKRSISEDNIEQKYYLESQTLPKQAPWDFLLWERPSSWRFC